jgi:hypothetical protein
VKSGRLAVFLLVVVCFGSGCRSVTVDVVSTFIFEANVKAEANEALGGVTVSFVDTGLDAQRAKRKSELKVGVTDNGGRLSVKWEYLWGYRKRVRQGAPAIPGTFLVTLRHEKFETIEKSFRLVELPRAGREYVVTLSVQMKERVDSGDKSESASESGGMGGVRTHDFARRRVRPRRLRPDEFAPATAPKAVSRAGELVSVADSLGVAPTAMKDSDLNIAYAYTHALRPQTTRQVR